MKCFGNLTILLLTVIHIESIKAQQDSTTAPLIAAVNPPNDGLDWMKGGYGAFLTCPAGDYIFGMCQSGSGGCCQDNAYTGIGCGKYPEPKSMSNNNGDEELEDINGWQCSSYGHLVSCPQGEAMIGACGSGSNADCKTNCDSASYFAIKCKSTPANDLPLNEGKWLAPSGWCSYHECPKGQVMCGACMSGKNQDCQGGSYRLKCCDPSPFSVVGSWIYQFSVATATKYSLSYGTTKTQSSTKTQSWSDSATTSVSAGLEVEGNSASTTLSLTESESYSSTYSYTWSVSETTDFEVDFAKNQVGMAVWQWKFDITDNDGNNVHSFAKDYAVTASRDTPPKCQPGYASGRKKSDYQECMAGYYLPGFDSTTHVYGNTTNLMHHNITHHNHTHWPHHDHHNKTNHHKIKDIKDKAEKKIKDDVKKKHDDDHDTHHGNKIKDVKDKEEKKVKDEDVKKKQDDDHDAIHPTHHHGTATHHLHNNTRRALRGFVDGRPI